VGRHRKRPQQGQAIVLVALMIVVLFGFVGLAIDSGRAYLDRRHLQAAADAAALAAAYTYMNTQDYASAELVAANTYAKNQGLYGAPTCTGLGTVAVSCTFGDPWGQALSINVTNRSIAGVSFAVSGSHSMPVAIMQVLGAGTSISLGAAATAVARKAGTNGAAIQTLSPGGCSGGGGNSLVFTGTSTTTVTGDVWSNGSITDSGQANGSVNGNAIDICPNMPPSPLPNFTVTGAQVNGWTQPDPGYVQPAIDATSRSWNSTSGAVEQPGAYASDPRLGGGAGCYFLAGGVYDFQAGFTQNGGFVSNELRPPDEASMVTAGQPNMTTTTGSPLSGTITSISVNALPGAVVQNSQVSVGGQTFTVSRDAAVGATSLAVNRQAVAGTIATGSLLTVRALNQFWDSNGVNCGSTFTATPTGSSTNNLSGTWSVELTAVRWEPNGVSSCGGPASPTCYLRESAPSMCKTVVLTASSVIKVSITAADPGAQEFNVYLSQNGSCTGVAYVTSFSAGGGASVTINSSTFPAGWPSGQPSPPDGEGLPMASGLPNADPAAAKPPNGDLANERHCVDVTTGNNIACPGAFTPGAVVFFIPGGGSISVCLNLQGGGDIYVYSGYQYGRILLYEPGPQQQPPANTCPNNVAGHGITSLIGIFYIPAAGVTIVGNSSYLATIAGGVIAWTASVKGNGGVSISADPTLRTWPPSVRLTQ
jgi:Flp pilus assembly protein TadG